MPRTVRTPPPVVDTDNQEIMSTPNMYLLTTSEQGNVAMRNKRLRPDFSPVNEFKAFQDSISTMLSTWKTEQDLILNKLSKDIAEVKQQNLNIQKTNSEIEKALEFMNNSYENMRQALEKLEKEKLEQRNYILQLERKVSDLQQNYRSSSIEIRNVPQGDKETTCDLTSTVIQTCNAVQVSVKTSELRDVFRLPGKKGANRPIVAEFLSVPLKNQVLNATRTFNKGLPSSEKLNTGHIGISGQLTPIYVAEHLPGSIRQLFYESRNFCKTHNYKFCWFRGGKIFLKEREGMDTVIVHSSETLKLLLKK